MAQRAETPNPHMQTDMPYYSTDDLLRSYAVANNKADEAAHRVWKRALEDIEMSFVEGCSNLSFEVLRDAVVNHNREPLEGLLWGVCDTSPWVLIPHRAKAVKVGGLAAEQFEPFAMWEGRDHSLQDVVCGALVAVMRPQIHELASAALERRVAWAMQYR
jgi:hypothetical protein